MTGVRMSEGTARKLYAELRIAGYGRDANGQLEGDLGHGRGAGRDEAEDLRGGDRVPVVGVVEQEPSAGRAGQQDQVPAAGEEGPQPHLVTRPGRPVPADLAIGESEIWAGAWPAFPWDLDLEIMLHCVALPWDTKTGSPPGAGRVRAAAGWGLCGGRAGGGRGGRCTVEVTCRPSSSLVLGPFEAVI